jgi:hypothetical protein
VFDADTIDPVKRQAGQTRDLARAGQAQVVREKVADLHRQGYGRCRIARETGLSRNRVARLLKAQGVGRGPSTPASACLPQILNLRRQGHGFAAIGRRLGFSRNAVR